MSLQPHSPPAGTDPPTPAAMDARAARLSRDMARQNRRAIEEFYSEWFDECLRIAHSITRRDESFCLDIVQDAMLRVIRHIRPLPDHASLRRWLHRVVHTAALDLLKSESRRAARHRALPLSVRSSFDPAATAERNDLIAAISAELQRLSAQDRSVFIRRFAFGHALRVAGNTSAGAAHGRLRRLVSRLQRLYGRQLDE